MVGKTAEGKKEVEIYWLGYIVGDFASGNHCGRCGMVFFGEGEKLIGFKRGEVWSAD